MSFNVGDVIECVDASDSEHLFLGGRYLVTYVLQNGTLRLCGTLGHGKRQDRFVLIRSGDERLNDAIKVTE